MYSARDCVLAATGGGSDALGAALLIGALLLLAGGAVLIWRRVRRSGGRGRAGGAVALGALALVAGLALAPLGGAAPANAAQSSGATQEDCRQQQAQQAPVADTEDQAVTPAAPTLARVACGEEPTIVFPETTGVVYTEERDGATAIIRAAAAEGYRLADGATSEWRLGLTPAPCACVPDPLGLDTPFEPAALLHGDNTSTIIDLPAGWVDALVAAGATFSVSQTVDERLGVHWLIDSEEIQVPDDEFVQHVEITRVPVPITTPDFAGLNFDLMPAAGDVRNPELSAWEQFDTRYSALQSEYPGVTIEPDFNGRHFFASTTTLRVEVTDSCGTPQVREYAVTHGGGLGQ